MICLKGNESVVVGCLDRLKLATVVNKPNGYCINVFVFTQGVGKSDSYPVFLTEVGNIFASIINSKVIDGVVAYLSKLIAVQSEASAVVTFNLVGGNGNGLIADRIYNAAVKTDVRVIQLDLLVGKILCSYFIGNRTRIYRYVFGGRAYRAGIGSCSVVNGALNPIMTCFVCGDLLGLFVFVSANVTLEGLFTRCRAGCGRADACYVIMIIYRFVQDFFRTNGTGVY